MPDNDWVLPGPATATSRAGTPSSTSTGGAYYIVDTSRNGVYINGADAPVGRRAPAKRLFDGDRLRLGEYEMACQITEEADWMRRTMACAIPSCAPNSSMKTSPWNWQLVDENSPDRRIGMLARHLNDADAFRAAQPAKRKDFAAQPDTRPDAEVAAHEADEQRAVEMLLQAAGLKPSWRGRRESSRGNPAERRVAAVADSRRRTHAFAAATRPVERCAFRLSQTMIQGAVTTTR